MGFGKGFLALRRQGSVLTDQRIHPVGIVAGPTQLATVIARDVPATSTLTDPASRWRGLLPQSDGMGGTTPPTRTLLSDARDLLLDVIRQRTSTPGSRGITLPTSDDVATSVGLLGLVIHLGATKIATNRVLTVLQRDPSLIQRGADGTPLWDGDPTSLDADGFVALSF